MASFMFQPRSVSAVRSAYKLTLSLRNIQVRLFTNTGSAFRSHEDARSRSVRILEVGPRDGLQNIKQTIDTKTKVQLIQQLAATGLQNIEATSFVSPKWVPQLADSADLMRQISPLASQAEMRFPVLVPNLKGLEAAIKSNAREIVVFASATEAFSQKNQNCTVAKALARAEEVVKAALKKDILVRG
jgi:hydroxymethylglutaryl-CoA lyase